MRRLGPVSLASLVVALAACADAGSGSPGEASQTPVGQGGGGQSASGAASTAESPAFTTGPGGSPIGDWSLTLTGGPSAGTYGGRDEMICTTVGGGPTAVAFNPVGSPPIGHADAGTDGTVDTILVSAGGLESGATYQASDADVSGSAEVLQGPTVTDGILRMTVTGTQQFPGEPRPRTMTLEVTCPLFPAETDG